LRLAASSWAKTTARRDWLVNRSNMAVLPIQAELPAVNR